MATTTPLRDARKVRRAANCATRRREDSLTKPTFSERISEVFTFARAKKDAASAPEATRLSLASGLTLGRQKQDAAEALFDNGHPAEAILLSREALTRTVDALQVLRAPESAPKTVEDAAEATPDGDDAVDSAKASADAAPPGPDAKQTWREVLQSRDVDASTLEAIQAVMTANEASPPTLDAQVTPEHAALFHRTLAARQTMERAVAGVARAPADVRRSQVVRLSTLGLAGLGLVVGAYFALRTPTGVFASASEQFGGGDEHYQASNVLDGRPDTEWLLPDHTTGWVELAVQPPRRVERVSILNARNAPMHDRATLGYALEIYAHGELVQTTEGNFTFSTSPEAVIHDVGEDNVERIRVVVRSSHNFGGGLAEVSFQ